ncbi:MAG: type IV pilus biogenesis protein PilP [Alphaproteobacteria bacterium]|nr:type IV pilus biogenesis protein PilP [Alphaproteobacteria bacterium]
MQNKLTSLTVILLTTIALGSVTVQAQNMPVKQATKPAVAASVKSAAKTTQQAKKAAKPATKPVAQVKLAEPVKMQAPTNLTLSAVQAENKRRLEEELKNTTISGKSIADFPNRPSLGSMELAPLPGMNDSAIRGPLPMAASVSGKDLPSEQLLGRITPEVFQEMADLERGNTFLKLQLEKEKLKNDLEKLKATYRQKRLDEIAKREDVVRSRIQWWQEQEKMRLAIAQKRAEEEALARKVAEQEATRNKVREEAMKRLEANTQAAQKSKEDKKAAKQEKPVIALVEPMEELYTLDSIRGVAGKLTARIKSKKGGDVITVKKDDILPSGHVVKKIEKDAITVAFGNRIDKLIFRPANK